MRGLLVLILAVAGACLAVDPDWQGASVGDVIGGSGATTNGETSLDSGGSDTGTDGDADGPDEGDEVASSDDGDSGEPPLDPLPADCGDLPALGAEAIIVGPQDNEALHEIIGDAAEGATIALEPGSYPRAGLPPIIIRAASVSLRSTTGIAADVVLDGGNTDLNQLIRIAANDTLIADITLQGVLGDLVFIRPDDTDVARPSLYRLVLRDALNTKVRVHGAQRRQAWVDGGVIACTVFEMTDAFRETQTDCSSMAAIRVAGGADWVVRDNRIHGHWCRSPTYAVIVFDNGARDVRIFRNRLTDNHRGILIGGENITTPRPADGTPCGESSIGGWGAIGGVVENNVIWVGDPALAATDPEYPADSMLGFWHVCGGAAVHNTIVNDLTIFNAIEWRFADTSVTISNNLTTGEFQARNGGFASGLEANVTLAPFSEFVAPLRLDFHLAQDSVAIDAGHIVPGLFTATDYDRNARIGAPDLGAYERAP